jgi:hypothetical protein
LGQDSLTIWHGEALLHGSKMRLDSRTLRCPLGDHRLVKRDHNMHAQYPGILICTKGAQG